jgi:hypothetical protein
VEICFAVYCQLGLIKYSKMSKPEDIQVYSGARTDGGDYFVTPLIYSPEYLSARYSELNKSKKFIWVLSRIQTIDIL